MESNSIVISKPELDIRVSFLKYPVPIVNGIVSADVLLEINPIVPEGNAVYLDFCFVIDCSGSMMLRANPNHEISKIDVVSQAIIKILNKMSSCDHIRVIGFSEEAFEVIPWMEATACNKDVMIELLKSKLHALARTCFKEALQMSLDGDFGNTGRLPCVVFLTDGQSSVPYQDYPFIVKYADRLRQKQIPIIVYGTGPDYHLNLLQQLAVRAGNGSFQYHIMSADDLESHFTGEMAFRHGFCLEHVKITVSQVMGKFSEVFRFIPNETQLEKPSLENLYSSAGGSCVSPFGEAFQNICGAVDYMRGQKFLFHVEIPVQNIRSGILFNLEIEGNKPGTPRFKYVVQIPVVTSSDGSTQPSNSEVAKYQSFVEATKAVKAGEVEKAAEIYRGLGNHATADTLIQMTQQGGDDAESTSRGTVSFASSSSSCEFNNEQWEEIQKRLSGEGKST